MGEKGDGIKSIHWDKPPAGCSRSCWQTPPSPWLMTLRLSAPWAFLVLLPPSYRPFSFKSQAASSQLARNPRRQTDLLPVGSPVKKYFRAAQPCPPRKIWIV